MGGSWIVIGASLLGVVSIALIAGSLWANSRARKRPRQVSMVSGSYAPLPMQNPGMVAPVAAVAPVYVPPPSAEHTLITAPPVAGHTVIIPAPSPYAPTEHEPSEQATQFLTVDDMFALADDRVEPTQILSDDDLLAAAPMQPVAPVQPVAPAQPVVQAAVTPTPRPSIPVSSTPVARSPIPAASIPSPQPKPAPAPSKPAPPPANQFAPPDAAAFAKQPVRAGPTPYVGYVAPRGPDDVDDDDDDDDDDPGTELVHQAELLRLMMKSRPPE